MITEIPSGTPSAGSARAETGSHSAAGIWTILEPVKGQIGLAMVLSTLSGLCWMAALFCVGQIATALSADRTVWPYLPFVGAFSGTVAAYFLRLTAFNQSHLAAFRLEKILRSRLVEHVSRLSTGEVQTFGAMNLAKVIQEDVEALHVFAADSTPLYARAYAIPFATFLALLYLDWRLALAALAVPVFGFSVLALAMRDFRVMATRYNRARELVAASIVEFVQAMPIVRSFDTGHSTFGRYQNALDSFLKTVTDWYRSAAFTGRFAQAILGPLPTLCMLTAVGLFLLQRGALDFATWLSVLLIGSGMAEAMMPMMTLNHLTEKARIGAVRIGDVLALPEMPSSSTNLKAAGGAGDLVFDKVSFTYDGRNEVLSDISFCVGQGTTTALVGPSGSGKSTLAMLAARYWDVSQGTIRIGGRDIRDIDPDSSEQSVGLVLQDTFLFATSILDNIRLGRPSASFEDVVSAARAARAHDFILDLPQGYDTIAGERGVFLSGGQKQRIAIARTILLDRPILILDEATAYADPENEAGLMEALSSIACGKTVLIVAHRLRSIRGADQILVLDQGRIVERGRHNTLLAKGGLYASLWHRQERAGEWGLRNTGRVTV